MLDTDIAWAAGFIDGEGCFTIVLDAKVNHQVRLIVTNTRIEPIEKLVRIFGGGTVSKRSRYLGKKSVYEWALHSKKAVEAARLILPYLTVKRENAEIFLEFQTTVYGYGRNGVPREIITKREEMKQKIHILNKRGA